MGLDITAYSKLTKLDALFNDDGEPVSPQTREPIEFFVQFYVNGDFPGRNGSVEHKAVYAYEDSYGFCAGGYSGYNRWREQLAELADYPAVEYETVEGYAPSRRMRRDAAAWKGLCNGKPFVELVNFSDCEGVIGPEVAAKLAKDFSEFDERAKAIKDEWFYEKYNEWRKAFEMAANGGAVKFH